MVNAVIFDCFGVLIADSSSAAVRHFANDDATIMNKVWNEVRAADAGLVELNESNKRIAKLLRTSLGKLQSFYKTAEHKNIRLLVYIESLRARGYDVGLLSNVSKGGIAKRFSEEEIARYFNVVVESAGLGIIKPDPKIYRYMAEKLGVLPEECVMIDDHQDCCAGAEAVGMKSIYFTETHACIKQLEELLDAN